MMSNSKPLLLVFPFGYLSHYLRCIVLCRQLASFFEIKFAFHPSYMQFVEAEGVDSFNCTSFDETDVLSKMKQFDFSWLNEKDIEKVMSDQAAVIRQYRPALVLGDTAPSLKMAAELADVPFISLMNGYMTKYYAETRSLSHTHAAYPFLHKLPVFVKDFLTKKGEAHQFVEIHKPFKKLRAKYGLRPMRTYLDEMEGDQNFLCDLPELFPQTELTPAYTSIGPLVYEGGPPARDKDNSPRLYQLTQSLQALKQTIFISMGSTGNWESLRFLNDHSFSRYNIVTAGDVKNVLHASHILSHEFLSPCDILPLTDLVICHGGNGTIYQALAHGIPVLCRTNHFEQEWNVAAIEKAGLGRSLDHIGEADCNNIISEWIERKGLLQHQLMKEKIERSRLSLPQKLADVAALQMQETDRMEN